MRSNRSEWTKVQNNMLHNELYFGALLFPVWSGVVVYSIKVKSTTIPMQETRIGNVIPLLLPPSFYFSVVESDDGV